MTDRRLLLAHVFIFLSATCASAQLVSDRVPRERTVSLHDTLDNELEASRRLGVFRVLPVFTLRDIGYERNVFGTSENPINDWRSTIAAGAKVTLPVGPKVYLRGGFVPEYTWYRRLSDRRRLGGDYSGSIYGLFNRLTLEATGTKYKGFSTPNTDVDRLALGNRTELYGRADVSLYRRLSVYATNRRQQFRFPSADGGDQVFRTLARDEASAAAGITYRFASALAVSLGAESTRTDFVERGILNNRSRAAVLGFRYERPRSFVNVQAGFRKGEPYGHDSAFLPYSSTTGSYYVSHELSVGIVADAYGHRGINYAATQPDAVYFEVRNGGGLAIPIGRRVAVRGFGERGTNDYRRSLGTSLTPHRVDDVTTFGGGLAFLIYRTAVLAVSGAQLRYSSNLPGFDRSTFRLSTVVRFGKGSLR